jgi:hypothetical protein
MGGGHRNWFGGLFIGGNGQGLVVLFYTIVDCPILVKIKGFGSSQFIAVGIAAIARLMRSF